MSSQLHPLSVLLNRLLAVSLVFGLMAGSALAQGLPRTGPPGSARLVEIQEWDTAGEASEDTGNEAGLRDYEQEPAAGDTAEDKIDEGDDTGASGEEEDGGIDMEPAACCISGPIRIIAF